MPGRLDLAGALLVVLGLGCGGNTTIAPVVVPPGGITLPDCADGQVIVVAADRTMSCGAVQMPTPIVCPAGQALTSNGAALQCASCSRECADLGASDLGDPVDMSVAPDLGMSPDLATLPDLSMPPDLTTPPDLTMPPDMTGAPDLAMPPDMTGAPDLAMSLDMTMSPDMTVPLAWAQEAYVKASNAGQVDHFGNAVAISGDTVVVGAPLESSKQTTITNGPGSATDNDAANAGAAYVYRRTANMWAQEAYLKASNGAAGDMFGHAVAISGDTIVVGATGRSSGAGAAYVFTRTASTWAEQAVLLAGNADASDQFGYAVAIDVDTIAVGANGEASNQTTVTDGTGSSADNSAKSAGAVYVFKRAGSTWTQEAYVKASNANASDEFGLSVAIAGDTLVIGAPGESSDQTTITNGPGSSASNMTAFAGAAYVYRRTGVLWRQEAYLKAPNPDLLDEFGWSVAISGDTIAVGAINESSNQTTITNGPTASSDNTEGAAGAVYVFSRSGSSWTQQAYVKAANAGVSDRFGRAVALLGDTLVVGAIGESSTQGTITNGATASANDDLQDAGAAFVYRRTGTAWAQEAYLKAPNPGSFDQYGASVGVTMSGGSRLVVVGADRESSDQTTITHGPTVTDNDNAIQAGAAYVVRY